MSATSELTQQFGSLTRLASDLGQVHEKIHLYDTFLSGLRQHMMVMAINNGYWQQLSMTAKRGDGNGVRTATRTAIAQGWGCSEDGHQWWLSTKAINNGARTARELLWDGAQCKDGNGERMVMARGWRWCGDGYQQRPLAKVINDGDWWRLSMTAVKGGARTARVFLFNFKDFSKDSINWLLVLL